MKISIKTQLDSRIENSNVHTHYEWNLTPRNLMKAVDTLATHRAEMTRAYGNVGRGSSWIEIDGVKIDNRDWTGTGIGKADFDPAFGDTRTQNAAFFIQNFRKGI